MYVKAEDWCDRGARPVKKILLAHDLSRRSSIALERAVQLAQQKGAALEILHVIEDDLPTAVIDRRRCEAAAVINAELSCASRGATEAAVNVLVGRDYTDILSWAETSCADLIVLGAHRQDALRPLVIGTTAERIIGCGTRPVLVVRDPPAGRYGRIVVAVDFTASARWATAFAFELLPDAEFYLIHAAPITGAHPPSGAEAGVTEKIESRLRSFCPQRPTRTHLVIRQGSPIAEIRDAVNDFDADLLVIGAQRRSGLTRTLIGAIPEDLLAAPPCDLMVVHASP
jgi:nucleotide-binding universal stress UspA family protein